MREVAVHLEHELGALREHVPEPVGVRASESLLARPVEHLDPRQLAREPVGDLARPVGGAVVDDEDVDVLVGESPNHLLEVLALVVGGEADDGAGHAHIIAGVAELPPNAVVADQIDLLADLLELEGKDTFRVVAYRRAAARVRETAGSVAQLALDGRAKELQGIGKTIEEKIVEIVEIGEIQALTKKKAGVPPEVVLFMKLPGLGPKTAARIWHELGVETLDELKVAAESERLRTLAGLGPKSEEKILAGLAYQAESPETDRYLLGRGLPAVQAVVAALRELPAAIAVSEAGSVRRRKETFRDLDIIASATNPADLTGHFASLEWVVDVAAQGDTKATVVSRDGLRFDLRVVPPESFGNLLQHFTGSKDHNVAMREEAVRRGFSISEYGVTNVETGDVFKSAEEDDVYEFLGYQPIPPELRENSGRAGGGAARRAAEARRAARRPRRPAHALALVGRRQEHARGDARGRGGPRLRVLRRHRPLALPPRAGGCTEQLAEIEQLRRRFPKLRILAGVEANIRSSGEVDVADEDLALLDWVVASVHQAPDSRPTERVLEAMQNPYVDAIGHLTGRRIGKRPPRDVDVERVIEGALETGTLLEINGQPDRLDLRDVHARAAKEAGLKLIASSDGHEVRSQAYVELAVAQARRGWLTKADLANTRTWKQLDKLRKKRP